MGASHGKVKKHQPAETTTQHRSLPVYNYRRPPEYYCKWCKNWIFSKREYTLIDEGRKVCPMCYLTTINVEQDFKPLVDDVKRFFYKNNLTLKQPVRILLVHEAEIRKHSRKSGNKILPNVTYLGLTAKSLNLSRVQTVTRLLEKEGQDVDKVEVYTKTEKLSTSYGKQHILILYGLPGLQAGAILAHEMLHAWFNEQGLERYLDKEVNEGFCELISYLWTYEHQIMEGDVYLTNLRSVIINEFDSNQKVGIRSTGFKKARLAFRKYGNNLEQTLRAVSFYRNFPP